MRFLRIIGADRRPHPEGPNGAWESAYVGAMADYPRVEYTLRDIRRAGEIIASDLRWTADAEPNIRESFRIANNWRDAHAFPMRSLRGSLRWYMHSQGIDGVTAARLKRMQAIRRKLRRIGLKLNQLQDLGGCRAIVATIDDVSALVDCMRHCKHDLRHEDDYISAPKHDGYRSHHLIFNYSGKGDRKIYDGKRVEIQIRTRLQHAWATAVEAVGLFLGEYLKGGQGSEEWLRLFKLMSAEFACAEGRPEPPDVPSQSKRRSEIIDLDKALQATRNLDKLSHAVRFTDISVSPREKPTYYLIRYINKTNEVSVEPYIATKSATASYGSAEFLDNRFGQETENIVLVEADKLDSLKQAYPNYFGDVQLFRLQLRNITQGSGVKEYTLRPQEHARPRPGENPDVTWLRRRIRWTEHKVTNPPRWRTR